MESQGQLSLPKLDWLGLLLEAGHYVAVPNCSAFVSDWISDASWTMLSPPLVMERTLLIISVLRFRVLALASKLVTLQPATCIKVMGYFVIVSMFRF